MENNKTSLDTVGTVGNTDFVRTINYLNQMKINYEINFHEEINQNSAGEKYINFIYKGEEISDYWEICLKDVVLDIDIHDLKMVFTEKQRFIGFL